MVTSDNDPRRATAGDPSLPSVHPSAAAAAPRSRASPHFGSRFSPSPRTLSTQLSTFSGNVSEKEVREGEAGYGGRQAASEKCPRSVTTPPPPPFFLLLLQLVLHPSRARERTGLDSERMGHTCAARILVFSFLLPSFLPSFPSPPSSAIRATPSTSSISRRSPLPSAKLNSPAHDPAVRNS